MYKAKIICIIFNASKKFPREIHTSPLYINTKTNSIIKLTNNKHTIMNILCNNFIPCILPFFFFIYHTPRAPLSTIKELLNRVGVGI